MIYLYLYASPDARRRRTNSRQRGIPVTDPCNDVMSSSSAHEGWTRHDVLLRAKSSNCAGSAYMFICELRCVCIEDRGGRAESSGTLHGGATLRAGSDRSVSSIICAFGGQLDRGSVGYIDGRGEDLCNT